jgi:hypothetical protein
MRCVWLREWGRILGRRGGGRGVVVVVVDDNEGWLWGAVVVGIWSSLVESSSSEAPLRRRLGSREPLDSFGPPDPVGVESASSIDSKVDLLGISERGWPPIFNERHVGRFGVEREGSPPNWV